MADSEISSTIDLDDSTVSGDKKARGETRPFPRKTLSEALKIVHAIKDQNAGNPWQPQNVADAIGRKPRSSDFGVLVAAAKEYGITEGSNKSQFISLTDLGRQIAYPENESREKESLFSAFLKVDTFKRVFDYYKGNKIPEKKYFRNNLISNFKIIEQHADEFIELFEGNCRFFGIKITESVKFESSNIDELSSAARPNEEPIQHRTIIKSGRSKAFVIMPFVERNPARSDGFFREVYNSLIEPAAIGAGFEVDWANRTGSDVIQSTIINEVMDADLVIADLTDHNPNVLFELGLRLANNKGATALIKSKDTGRLFDVDNLIRVYEYNPVLWSSSLAIDKPNLEEHLRTTWNNRETTETYINILRRRIL